VNKLRQDCADFSQQINHLNYLISKLKQEISEKDNLIGRSLNDNDAELMTLRQQLEQKKSENAQLTSTIRDIRGNWKEAESEW